MTRKTERIGRSGEYLTCSFLARETDTVTLLPHSPHADLIFEWDKKIYRCQVKTVTHIEKGRKSWRFDLRKGFQRNVRRCRLYEDNMIDIYALANLKYQLVYFLPYKDCNKGQYSIQDSVMKSTNSIESLNDAMNSISGATRVRQEKNIININEEIVAINGYN